MDTAADKTTVSPGKKKSKKWLVVSGIGVALILAAYVTGRVQTHAAIGVAEDQQKQAETTAQTSQQKVDELEARRRLELALRQIDHRNFGTAADELRVAAQLLGEAKPEGDLAKLQKDLADYRLVATEDVAKQREQVLAFVDRFDALVPPAKP